MPELQKYQFNEKYSADVSYLTGHYCLINVSNANINFIYHYNYHISLYQEGPRQALNYLQQRVRMFPHNPALRKIFVKFLLDYFPNDATYEKALSTMALITLKLRPSHLSDW